MKRVIIANTVTNTLDARTDGLLQDFAQVAGTINYNDIMEFGNRFQPADIKKLRSLLRKLGAICQEMGCDYWEAAQEDDEAADLVDEITSIVKGK